MLHEIAASDLEITNIVNPLRKLLRKFDVLVGDVNEIDLPNKQVLISHGYRNHSSGSDYDHLVVALGSITNFYDIPGLADSGRTYENRCAMHSVARSNHSAFGRSKFRMQSRRLSVVLTFVVAGGGFAGVENGGSVK